MAAKILTWERFFVAVCYLCAAKSKDPHTQVGACIVNDLNQIISTGYNGFPRGLNDEAYPWQKAGLTAFEIKYTYVVHAELNAIIAAKTNIAGCTLYTTLFPCANCAKIIIQAGIAKVVYVSDKYLNTPDGQAALKMLNDAEVVLTQSKPLRLEIT